MRSFAVLGLVALVGCAAPAAEEERELSTSNLEESEPEPLETGMEVTVRLSVDIRADLLPKAKVASMGPFQSITYGKPDILAFGAEGWRCEARGVRPMPGASEKYFPPVMPQSLRLAVKPRPEGTAGIAIFLEAVAPDAKETTWSLDCVQNGETDRGATLAELQAALGEDSSVRNER